jgi:hypothetical protein
MKLLGVRVCCEYVKEPYLLGVFIEIFLDEMMSGIYFKIIFVGERK